MNSTTRLTILRVMLVLVGAVFFLGVGVAAFIKTTLAQPPSPSLGFEQMFQSVYATLGIFLLLAARDPLANRSVIRFAVWSTVAHCAMMVAQAIAMGHPQCHFTTAGDVGPLLRETAALLSAAASLALFMPRGADTAALPAAG